MANYFSALLPVVFFLLALRLFDSFKLVSSKALAIAIVYGMLSAVMSYFANGFAMDWFAIDRLTLSRYVAPFIEEILKCALMIFLLKTKRVGFVVDAAIIGFAIGAGFALLENILYLNTLQNAPIATWIVRGFGTAIMHGGTVALMAIIAKMGSDVWNARIAKIFAGFVGLMFAIGIHMMYNHLLVSPLVSSLIIITTFPIILVIAFDYSERQTRKWLGEGLDKNMEILDILMHGDLPSSRIGIYLTSLKAHFEGPIMGDLINYLRLHLELSAQAKGVLMMKEYGISPPTDPTIEANLTELEYLKKSIGKTGMVALHPLMNMNDRDLWQLRMLRKV
jgi:RsiW-degrading membrane proteinase PrsW (M82 family)